MEPPEDGTAQLQRLLDRAAAGDEHAYGELIARASARLRKLVRRMLRNDPRLQRWEETDDVFQIAAMKLHRSLQAVKPDSPRAFFGLAATQVRRTLLDLARHHFGPEGQAARHHSSGGRGDLMADTPDPRGGPTASAWTAFHEAVEALPEDERGVVDLVWYGGLTQREAAALLAISEPTVKRRWRAARLHLHEALGGERPSSEE